MIGVESVDLHAQECCKLSEVLLGNNNLLVTAHNLFGVAGQGIDVCEVCVCNLLALLVKLVGSLAQMTVCAAEAHDEKLGILGGRELVVTIHKSGFAYGGAKGKVAFKEEFTAGLKRLARKAAEKGITVYLRNTHRRGPGAVDEIRGYVEAVAEPNFKYAPSVAHDMLGDRNAIGSSLSESARRAVDSGADLIYLSVPVKGFVGHFETAFGRLAEAKDQTDLKAALAILKKSGAKIVFAPFYDNFDQEYEDVKIFEAAQ